MSHLSQPPVVLSIAGTDPGGGAGIHADLKTFTARGVVGTTVITALVAQNTHGVARVSPVALDFVADQFACVLDDMPIAATKSGMLASRELVELVVTERQRRELGFFTVDPVMVATSGHRLLDEGAVATVRDQLLPVADLVTPNLPEAALLLNTSAFANGLGELQRQAHALLKLGAKAVLLKGGHGTGSEVINVLVTADGQEVVFRHPRIETANTHGTGCTLSAAITAEVAHLKQQLAVRQVSGKLLAVAVANALHWLLAAIKTAAQWQLAYQTDGSHGPVNHQVGLMPPRPFCVPLASREIRL